MSQDRTSDIVVSFRSHMFLGEVTDAAPRSSICAFADFGCEWRGALRSMASVPDHRGFSKREWEAGFERTCAADNGWQTRFVGHLAIRR
jgi:hypothetical protein